MDIFDWIAEIVLTGFDVLSFAELHPIAAILRTVSVVLIAGSLLLLGLDLSGGFQIIPLYWAAGLLLLGLSLFLSALLVAIVTRKS